MAGAGGSHLEGDDASGPRQGRPSRQKARAERCAEGGPHGDGGTPATAVNRAAAASGGSVGGNGSVGTAGTAGAGSSGTGGFAGDEAAALAAAGIHAELRPVSEHRATLRPGDRPPADRPLVLFDIHGVLGVKRPHPAPYGQPRHRMRPGVEHILRLTPHFRLGVFSSGMKHTVRDAIGCLEAALGGAAAARGLPPGAAHLPVPLFDLVMWRDHARPDPHRHARHDGEAWDTIKPLALHGLDLARTVLVDNDAHKAWRGEAANMVLLPHWAPDTGARGRAARAGPGNGVGGPAAPLLCCRRAPAWR